VDATSWPSPEGDAATAGWSAAKGDSAGWPSPEGDTAGWPSPERDAARRPFAETEAAGSLATSNRAGEIGASMTEQRQLRIAKGKRT